MISAAILISFSFIGLIILAVWSGKSTLSLAHKLFDAWGEGNKPYALINVFFILVGLALFVGAALSAQWWAVAILSGGGTAS